MYRTLIFTSLTILLLSEVGMAQIPRTMSYLLSFTLLL